MSIPTWMTNLGIALGMKVSQVERAIRENPDAVAILVNNPTYYGICSDLPSIVALAHRHHMLVLADEAHGTHFYFGDHLPVSAMDAGADLASVSMHKSGGSLTQSSFLLSWAGRQPWLRPPDHQSDPDHQRLLPPALKSGYLPPQSRTSGPGDLSVRSSILRSMPAARSTASADIMLTLMNWSTDDSIFAFDVTKLAIHTLDIGLAGIEVYDLLRDEYDIQIEFGDIGNVLAYLSIGDRRQDVERLISALAEIRRRYQRDKTGMLTQEYIEPKVIATPQRRILRGKGIFAAAPYGRTGVQ